MSKYADIDRVNDEVVRVLEHTYCKDEYIDRVLRAIESLPTIEVSEDAIDRQDAVKAIAKQLGRMHDTNPEAWEDVAKLWLGDCK